MENLDYMTRVLSIYGGRTFGSPIEAGFGLLDLIDTELANIEIAMRHLTEWEKTLRDNKCDALNAMEQPEYKGKEQALQMLYRYVGSGDAVENEERLFYVLTTTFHRLQKLIELQREIDSEDMERLQKEKQSLSAEVEALKKRVKELEDKRR